MALTQERLKHLLQYDPNTGIWTWNNPNPRSGRVSGEVAGGPTLQGYWRLRVDCVSYRSARLAWFYMTGEWPVYEVDHINSDPSDDRWENLQSMDQAQNLRKRNFDAMRGISCHGRKFSVSVCGEYHGMFDRIEAALAIRDFALWYNDIPVPEYEVA